MLNTRSIFDPRFTRAVAQVGQGAMTSSVLVRRPLPEDSPLRGGWDYDKKKHVGEEFITLWAGPARVQPNKDWRAKSYEFASTTTAIQACRFSLPLADGVWNGALTDDEREMRDEDRIFIVDNAFPHLDAIKRFVYIVRNGLVSGNAGLQNVLCDVDLKGVNVRDDS